MSPFGPAIRFKAWFVEKFKGWRTIAANVVLALPPVLDALSALDMKATFGDKWGAIYGVAVVLVNLYLRTLTTTAVGEKA